MKICIACSSGGHFKEAQKAIKLIEPGNDIFWVTIYSAHLKSLSDKNRIYYVKDFKDNKAMALLNMAQSLYIYLKEKPDIIISTGASVAIPICLFSRVIFRKRLVYIESGGQVHTPSKTGKLLYRFADLFIVQWKETLKYFPKARYGGNLF